MEALIQRVKKDAVAALFNAVFATQSENAAYDRLANYVLQRWLEFAENASEIQKVAVQLLPKVPDLLRRRPQVVVSLSAALAKCQSEKHQKQFVEVLLKEFREIRAFLEGVAAPNGSKILQNVCFFEEGSSKQFVEAVKKLGGQEVVSLALDQSGSFLISEFVKSGKIDLQSRLKVIRRLVPKIKEMALSKYGAFVVEAAFQAADLATKIRICEGLVDKSVENGASYIWKNFRMERFIDRRVQWEKDTVNLMKKRDAMAEIIEAVNVPDVVPLAPKIAEATPEMEAAAHDLEQVIGVLHRRRKRHRKSETDE
jgi:hypothetical protein